LDLTFKAARICDHVAKFHDRSRELRNSVAKCKKAIAPNYGTAKCQENQEKNISSKT